MRIIRIVLCSLFLFPLQAYTSGEILIENVMSHSKEPHQVVFVDKGSKKLYLLEVYDGKQKVLDEINVLIGEYDGDKEIEGDKKTPEGVYYIVSYMSEDTMARKFTRSVSAKYGTGAFPINYPNVLDKIEKKTGYGIWIHGLDPERGKITTQGCIAMENNYLDELKKDLFIGMPVIIAAEGTYCTKAEYENSIQDELNALNSFINAWAYGSYDEFESYVHPKYSSYSARNASTFLAKKKHLMNAYPDKKIDVSNVDIYKKGNGMVLYDFDQLYCADNLVSYGNKRIYMDNGKIISEEMHSKPSYDYMSPYIAEFVNEWKNDWEARDIDKYTSRYAKSFKGYKDLRKNKQQIFDNAGKISVEINTLKWRFLEGNKVEVTFKQKYTSEAHSDTGIKKLVIKGCPGDYQILSEDWRRQ